MRTINIRRPDDFHVHIRQGELMPVYLSYTARIFGRALIMPNILPPVGDCHSLRKYKAEIEAAAPGFTPLMSFKLRPGMGTSEIRELKKCGAIAGKYYPAGATTNSEDGITHWTQIRKELEVMEKEGIVFSFHGEVPEAPSLQREQDFVPYFQEIRKNFPDLKIVFEHVSSKAAVEAVWEASENTAASITLHHLLLTVEDIIGGGLNPHLFCRPLPKTNADREAVRNAAFSGNLRFFFGSDSAPHPRENKECAFGAAGIFTSPVLLPALVSFFDEQKKLDLLESFISRFGAEFYGLELSKETITLKEEKWRVPESCGGAVPLFAGQQLSWKIADQD